MVRLRIIRCVKSERNRFLSRLLGIGQLGRSNKANHHINRATFINILNFAWKEKSNRLYRYLTESDSVISKNYTAPLNLQFDVLSRNSFFDHGTPIDLRVGSRDDRYKFLSISNFDHLTNPIIGCSLISPGIWWSSAIQQRSCQWQWK
jgi:hypothetical protein